MKARRWTSQTPPPSGTFPSPWVRPQRPQRPASCPGLGHCAIEPLADWLPSLPQRRRSALQPSAQASSYIRHPNADPIPTPTRHTPRPRCPPAGALDERRLQVFLERFEGLRADREHEATQRRRRGGGGGGEGQHAAVLPPFHYGSHYSNAGACGWVDGWAGALSEYGRDRYQTLGDIDGAHSHFSLPSFLTSAHPHPTAPNQASCCSTCCAWRASPSWHASCRRAALRCACRAALRCAALHLAPPLPWPPACLLPCSAPARLRACIPTRITSNQPSLAGRAL